MCMHSTHEIDSFSFLAYGGVIALLEGVEAGVAVCEGIASSVTTSAVSESVSESLSSQW